EAAVVLKCVETVSADAGDVVVIDKLIDALLEHFQGPATAADFVELFVGEGSARGGVAAFGIKAQAVAIGRSDFGAGAVEALVLERFFARGLEVGAVPRR